MIGIRWASYFGQPSSCFRRKLFHIIIIQVISKYSGTFILLINCGNLPAMMHKREFRDVGIFFNF